MENWEIKDRLYILRNNKKPIIFSLAGKHSSKAPLLFIQSEGTGFPLTPDGGTVTITFPSSDPFILKV